MNSCEQARFFRAVADFSKDWIDIEAQWGFVGQELNETNPSDRLITMLSILYESISTAPRD